MITDIEDGGKSNNVNVIGFQASSSVYEDEEDYEDD